MAPHCLWNKLQILLYIWCPLWPSSCCFLCLISQNPIPWTSCFGHIISSLTYMPYNFTLPCLYIFAVCSFWKTCSPLLFIWFIIETCNLKIEIKHLLFSKAYIYICSIQWSLCIGFIFLLCWNSFKSKGICAYGNKTKKKIDIL